jgi:hypothetical protein
MSGRSSPRLARRRLLVLLSGGAAALVVACEQRRKSASELFGSHHTPAPAASAPTRTWRDVQPVDFSARFATFPVPDEPNGDLARVVWPDWIQRGDPAVKRLYEFQVVNGDLMKYMPCFCGCGRTDGHRSNRDCYVREVKADGSVVFDEMAPT